MGLKVFHAGLVIGRLTLIEEVKKNCKNFWKVKCQCGEEQYYRTDYISLMKHRGTEFECSQCKYQRRYPSLTNNVYGRLTVLYEVPSKTKNTMWLVRCECGVEKEIISSSLTSKIKGTKSCGCLCRKLNSKWVNTTQYPPAHQLKTKETEYRKAHLYHVRNHFVAACYHEYDSRYHNHGAKGHTVCDLWRNGAKDFVKWAMDNGYKKGDGIYLKETESVFSPENCYIQKKSDFARLNNSKFIKYKGLEKSLTDWAKEFNCTVSCLSSRLKRFKKYGINKIMDLNWIPEKKQIYGTEHFEDDIVSLYNQGYTYFEICQKIGCNTSTIRRFLKKNNVTSRKAVRRSVDAIKCRLKEIYKLKNEGKSYLEISKKLNINANTLAYHYRNYLKTLGE